MQLVTCSAVWVTSVGNGDSAIDTGPCVVEEFVVEASATAPPKVKIESVVATAAPV
jgi:hypothetical protein